MIAPYFLRLARALTMRPPFTLLRKDERAQAERDMAQALANAFDAGRRQGVVDSVVGRVG